MKIEFPFLIDGGLSNQLEKQGCNLNHDLWTAKLLDSDPQQIVNAHLAYLHAGAGCITTSSYQATLPGLMRQGYSKSESEKMILKTVKLAEEAIERFTKKNSEENTKPLIAASIGPYGAYLADGSEYRGNYGISRQELKDFHLPRIELLENTSIDLFAFETIPDFEEAEILKDILHSVTKPAWICFSCRDDYYINDGTPLIECIKLFSDIDGVIAVGVNCTAPVYISRIIDQIKNEMGGKKIIAYPNSGEVYSPESKEWSGMTDPGICEKLAIEWIRKGADIIGGCCRMGTEEIKAMARAIHRIQL